MEPIIQYPNIFSGTEDFSIDGIMEYKNIPHLEPQLSIPYNNKIFMNTNEYSIPVIESPVETTRELKLLGVKMDEHDDLITVGVVFVIAAAVWFTKSYIEYHFAKKLEDYKNK